MRSCSIMTMLSCARPQNDCAPNTRIRRSSARHLDHFAHPSWHLAQDLSPTGVAPWMDRARKSKTEIVGLDAGCKGTWRCPFSAPLVPRPFDLLETREGQPSRWSHVTLLLRIEHSIDACSMLRSSRSDCRWEWPTSFGSGIVAVALQMPLSGPASGVRDRTWHSRRADCGSSRTDLWPTVRATSRLCPRASATASSDTHAHVHGQRHLQNLASTPLLSVVWAARSTVSLSSTQCARVCMHYDAWCCVRDVAHIPARP